MGFIVGKIQSVKRKVEFKLPTDDSKPAQKADFIVTLKVRDAETTKARRAELQRFLAGYTQELRKVNEDPAYEMDVDANELDERYMHEDVDNLEGLFDEDGNALEFSTQLLSDVLNDLTARKALFTVWRELNLSEAGSAKRKN